MTNEEKIEKAMRSLDMEVSLMKSELESFVNKHVNYDSDHFNYYAYNILLRMHELLQIMFENETTKKSEEINVGNKVSGKSWDFMDSQKPETRYDCDANDFNARDNSLATYNKWAGDAGVITPVVWFCSGFMRGMKWAIDKYGIDFGDENKPSL